MSLFASANRRLKTLSRRSLSRALDARRTLHSEGSRDALSRVSVCHVNSDMWTSLANEPFASFVATWLDEEWQLRTAVLRCCILHGRHTASAIAAFFLLVAKYFDLEAKVGVVCTDGAVNCVGAGRELGMAAGSDGRRAPRAAINSVSHLPVEPARAGPTVARTARGSGRVGAWSVRVGRPSFGRCSWWDGPRRAH